MAYEGKTVSVHYVGTLDDGTEFDNSIKRDEPIEFVVGSGNIIPGFEAAIVEMEVGETRKVSIPPAEAYGEYDEQLVESVPLAELPMGDEIVKRVGKTIMMSDEEGIHQALIKEVKDGIATFDFNHPLAGQTLNFEITLVEVSEEVAAAYRGVAPDPSAVPAPGEPA